MRSSHGKKKPGQVAQQYVGKNSRNFRDAEKDRNRKRWRNWKEGGEESESESRSCALGCVGAWCYMCVCGYVYGWRMQGSKVSRASRQGWTRRFDGGSLMPKQSKKSATLPLPACKVTSTPFSLASTPTPLPRSPRTQHLHTPWPSLTENWDPRWIPVSPTFQPSFSRV